jgi:hypothetical protein
MNSTERFKIVMDILNKAELGISTRNIDFFRNLSDEELSNENITNDIINKINEYELSVENNTNNYSEEIMQNLRQREGLDKYDTSMDTELNKIEPDKAFNEVLQWNGLLGSWDYTIKCWIKDIYGIELGKQL